MIISLAIDGELPFVQGMKNLRDFKITNWFEGFPELTEFSAKPIGGYYFGKDVSDITLNSFNFDLAAIKHGVLSNESGYISVNPDNYLDTGLLAPVKLTIGVRLLRPVVPSDNTWFVADFSGTGQTGVGFAVGMGVNGKLRVAGQNTGNVTGIAEVSIPESIPVGGVIALTAYIRSGSVTIAVYDPSTGNYVSTPAEMAGTRPQGSQPILIGRKANNNFNNISNNVGAIVVIDGEVGMNEHIAVQKYLYNMA